MGVSGYHDLGVMKVTLGEFSLIAHTFPMKISLPQDDSYSLVQSISRMT